jgi:protein phosphatase-4 regulatory subunit 3
VTTSSFIPIDSCLHVFIDDAFHEGGGGEVIDLPPAELATLPQIAKTIGEVLPFNRERVATMVVRDQTYIHKLMEIFRICEERGNTECLRLMFKVVKGLISLNDGHIFDIIFSDEYMMDIVGALECKFQKLSFFVYFLYLGI